MRKSRECIRVPKFNCDRDRENYYYSLLIQYMPYRDKRKVLEGFNSAREAFLAKKKELREKSSLMDEFRKRDQELENTFTKAHAFQLLEKDEVQLEDFEEVNFEDYTRCIDKQVDEFPDRLKIFITGGAGTGKTYIECLQKSYNSVL